MSQFDDVPDEEVTFGSIDDLMAALASVPGIEEGRQEREAARLAWEKDWAERRAQTAFQDGHKN